MKKNKSEILVKLFNIGKLGLADAVWYQERGYYFLINRGRIVDIILEEQEYLR